MTYKIRNQEIEDKLRSVARILKKQMPQGWGFTILMFNYGENTGPADGLFYLSSANRQDMVRAMQEFIEKNKES